LIVSSENEEKSKKNRRIEAKNQSLELKPKKKTRLKNQRKKLGRIKKIEGGEKTRNSLDELA